MKRRRFQSILHVPYGCGWTAICEENKAWHLPNGAAEWVELPELPPVDDSDRPVIYQHVVGQCIAGGNGGLGSQDLPKPSEAAQ
jgi:hypothetical protein